MINIHLHNRIAILIDADNVQLSFMEQVLKISEYYGQLIICRAYGDWNESPLSSWCKTIEALKIERIQVDRVGKNATDHRLLMEAGEILGASFWESELDPYIFIIVSGDGDFVTPCRLIQEKGKKVIGIGNREQTSNSLRESCDKFYCLEDLDHELGKLEKLHPIPPSEVRSFSNPLFFAYHQLAKKRGDWVSYSQLGTKLRELVPDYESEFGKYKLSEWLEYFNYNFETREQRIRANDPLGSWVGWQVESAD